MIVRLLRDRRPAAIPGALLAFCLAAPAAAAISLRDDLGREVTLARPATRIVALAPFLTELAFAAGAGDRVVGVSAFSDFPPPARALPQVASAAGVSLEALAALHPDLVLAWKDAIRPDEVGRIAALGPAVFVAEARRIEDVPRLLRAMGRLAGHDAEAEARGFEARVAGLRTKYASRPEVAVFLEIWHRPLTTISGRHYMNQSLEICGARNVFAGLAGVAPVVSWEAVYAANPAVIVGVRSEASGAEFLAQWRERGALAAVRAGRLVYLPTDRLERPTPRLADGIEELCEAIGRAR